MNQFLEDLIKNIVANRLLPKIQVERQISPIFEIFIESLINCLAQDINIKKVKEGKYRFIASEFPLQTENEEYGNLRSSNIDFLLFNETEKSLLFVELKTDSSSFDLNQYTHYLAVIEGIQNNNSAAGMYTFLKSLQNDKYRYYKEYIVDANIQAALWSEIESADVLYIASQSIKDRQWGHIKRAAINTIPFIHFCDLPEQIEHDYAEKWELIRENLLPLDEN